MAVIHKCDACNRTIVADRTVVDLANYTDRFEFCGKCAAPIRATLKKYKLTTGVLIPDSNKLDQIIAMLGDMVEVFGKRFDKIDRDMATKDQIIALHTQVNSIETELRGMKHTELHARVADLEEEVFGETRA